MPHKNKAKKIKGGATKLKKGFGSKKTVKKGY